ncbi:MAG: 30S ribosomal protein S1 [Bacteroidetes bacterium]|nr:30S ribosomal protein S1 [Bacteroidota bacterium]MCL1969774.1 30S ribosomal protein S1 [Bacteroidota bacterium]
MQEELINAPEMEASNEEQVVELPVQEEIVPETSVTVDTSVSENPLSNEEEQAVELPAVEEQEEQAVELPAVEEQEEQAVELPAVEETTTAEELPTVKKPTFSKEIPVAYDSLENFNWDNLEKKGSKYSATEKERYAELYTKSFKSIDENAVIKGTIVSFNTREIVVNIGFKSDGVITASELRYNPNIKIGDEIEVYVENQEDATGQLQLSHKKARMLQSWNRVNQAYDDNEIITGYVKCRTKGGLIVDVFGIEAFLPGSQIDVKPIRDYDIYVNKTMEFKVVKINHEYKNVVVSHKALIEDELEAQKAEIIARLEKGQILEGIVKNITSYGVFIDLGGVDGLIHITDLSWGRINHPEEIVQLDEKINVVILDFNENKKRIALGLKQLTPHPWDALDADLKVGDKIKGKVVVIADYGAFIEVIPGVEGLIHVSEMSWSQHLRTAHDFLKVGDEVETVILTLDREERKMSLGIKQLIPDPWTDITTKYPAGSKHTAIVRNFTNFGIFVELEEGVDGLIHISDLSWSKKIKHPAEFTKIGDTIEVIVLEVDIENHRLSLGHKQLEENPWDVFETVFAVGTTHQGTIVAQTDKGYTISLPYGIEGFCFSRALQKEDKSNPKIEETLAFRVIEFQKDAKKINLSHTKTWQESKEDEEKRVAAEEKKQKKDIEKINENSEKTTLGDLDIFKTLKQDIENKEE